MKKMVLPQNCKDALEDRQYIIGVFGCEQKDDRFADTLQLFEQMPEK